MNLEDFKRSYSYANLIAKHSLQEFGFWKIFEGNRSPDSTSGPLVVVDGKLCDVIQYAVSIPEFSQRGNFGSIKRIKVLRVDEAFLERRQKLQSQIDDLHKKISDLQDELNKELNM